MEDSKGVAETMTMSYCKNYRRRCFKLTFHDMIIDLHSLLPEGSSTQTENALIIPDIEEHKENSPYLISHDVHITWLALNFQIQKQWW